jgi:hypothetical protein
LEERAGEFARARAIHERYLVCHQTLRSYLKVAGWETKRGQMALARKVRWSRTALGEGRVALDSLSPSLTALSHGSLSRLSLYHGSL